MLKHERWIVAHKWGWRVEIIVLRGLVLFHLPILLILLWELHAVALHDERAHLEPSILVHYRDFGKAGSLVFDDIAIVVFVGVAFESRAVIAIFLKMDFRRNEFGGDLELGGLRQLLHFLLLDELIIRDLQDFEFLSEEWMLQCIFGIDSLVRVGLEHFLDEVHAAAWGPENREGLEVDSCFLVQFQDLLIVATREKVFPRDSK